ncbi:MAG: D-glycero-beta-D-manno-heptose 1-phosphate adenylyltransferase [Saprospiraceae bacterium]|nr:D-glycero-beta-D-manno-heptose 1-phosphate adenylyltransferase [Saprospiraceae bacterium]
MNPNFQKLTDKIQNWTEAQKTVREWQEMNFKVVFTNGCFDLLHYGHLCYLSEAASLGQKLVVALNSDNSIRRLKGKKRPIKDNSSRIALMASLQFVDLVVEFDQDSPLELISTLRPNILVKGGDWDVEDIIGSEVVLANDGEVFSLNFLEGYSTTNFEKKILENQ